MKTKLITILLCLFPLLAYAQNYEQQGDELFAQAQYEKVIKKYDAAIVSLEMEEQVPSAQLKQKKDTAKNVLPYYKKPFLPKGTSNI